MKVNNPVVDRDKMQEAFTFICGYAIFFEKQQDIIAYYLNLTNNEWLNLPFGLPFNELIKFKNDLKTHFSEAYNEWEKQNRG